MLLAVLFFLASFATGVDPALVLPAKGWVAFHKQHEGGMPTLTAATNVKGELHAVNFLQEHDAYAVWYEEGGKLSYAHATADDLAQAKGSRLSAATTVGPVTFEFRSELPQERLKQLRLAVRVYPYPEVRLPYQGKITIVGLPVGKKVVVLIEGEPGTPYTMEPHSRRAATQVKATRVTKRTMISALAHIPTQVVVTHTSEFHRARVRWVGASGGNGSSKFVEGAAPFTEKAFDLKLFPGRTLLLAFAWTDKTDAPSLVGFAEIDVDKSGTTHNIALGERFIHKGMLKAPDGSAPKRANIEWFVDGYGRAVQWASTKPDGSFEAILVPGLTYTTTYQLWQAETIEGTVGTLKRDLMLEQR